MTLNESIVFQEVFFCKFLQSINFKMKNVKFEEKKEFEINYTQIQRWCYLFVSLTGRSRRPDVGPISWGRHLVFLLCTIHQCKLKKKKDKIENFCIFLRCSELLMQMLLSFISNNDSKVSPKLKQLWSLSWK